MVTKELNRLGAIILLLSAAIISYLIIIPGQFPYLGMSLSLGLLSSIAYIFKEEKTRFVTILYIFCLLFSFFIFYRANEFLTFLNIIGVFLTGSVMALTSKKDLNFGFFNFVLSPVNLLISALKTPSKYLLNLNFLYKSNQKSLGKAGEVIKSLLLTLVILAVIVPLLASANPFFNSLVGNILKFVDLSNLRIDGIFIVRVVFFLILAFIIPRMVTYENTSDEKFFKLGNVFHSVGLLLPKIIVSAVILIFFITQAQLYFATDDTLVSLGYSHSEYAREVFGQLSVVSLVILTLIYNDKRKDKTSKMLTYLLVLEGIFLSFMAFKSVYDYSSAWGFTQKRLWGFAGVFWSLSTYIFYSFVYAKKLTDSYFIKGAIIISALTLTGVNIANFDYLIYHYKKSSTGNGIDHVYLSRLSTDSQSFASQLENNKRKFLENPTLNQQDMNMANWRITRKVDVLKNRYSSIDFREFNFSEYKQYLQVKDINTQDYYPFIIPSQPVIDPVTGDVTYPSQVIVNPPQNTGY